MYIWQRMMSKRKRKQKTGICALCGTTGTVTREHVPPKNLFLKPRPTNTITTDLCEKCNHSFHLDDEYFRVFIAAGAQPGTKLWQLWDKKVVGSSFTRSGGLKGRLNDDHQLLRQHAESHPLWLYNGGIAPKEWLPIVQPFDTDRVNAVVEKIVRCLYFHHFGAPLEVVVKVDPSPLSDETWRQTFDNRSGEVGHNKEFVYRFQHNEYNKTIWRLIFYEHHAFTVRATVT